MFVCNHWKIIFHLKTLINLWELIKGFRCNYRGIEASFVCKVNQTNSIELSIGKVSENLH